VDGDRAADAGYTPAVDEKKNGHDPLTVEMVELLRQIVVAGQETNRRAEETNRRAEETNRRAEETNKRLEETNKRLEETNKRLDVLHDDVVDLRADVAGVKEEVHAFKVETRDALAAMTRREDKIADRVEGLPLEFHEVREQHAALEKRVAKVEALLLKPKPARRSGARR